jgi:hypothetical protein
MRWFVEISPIGSKTGEDVTLCVEAPQWQPALQKARALRGDNGALSNFSIELLDDGFRAIDPMTRLRYIVKRAPDSAVITNGSGQEMPPSQPPKPSATAVAPIAVPPPDGKKRAPAPTVGFGSSGSAVIKEPEPAPAPAPVAPLAATPLSPGAVVVPAADGNKKRAPAQTVGFASTGAAAVNAAAAVPAPPPPRAPMASFVIIGSREDDPTEASPLIYREYVYAVAQGTSEEDARHLILERFEQVRDAMDPDHSGRFINLAIFDHIFQGRPLRRPLVTLTWKDWKLEEPEIHFPQREAARTPSAVPPAASAAKPALVAPAPAASTLSSAKPAVAPKAEPEPKVPVVSAPKPAVAEAPKPAAKAPEAPKPAAKAPEAPRPAAVVEAPKPAVTETPNPVSDAVTIPKPVAVEAPKPTVAETKPVAEAPKPAAAEAPKPATAEAPKPVAEAPKPAAAEAPKPVAEAPKPVAAEAPKPVVEAPKPAVAEAPKPAATPEPVPETHPVPTVASPVAASPDPAPAPAKAEAPKAAPAEPAPAKVEARKAARAEKPGDAAAPKPAAPKKRLVGDELLAELFEAAGELHFARDTLDGADTVLRVTLEKLPSEVGLVSLFDMNKREFVVVRQVGGPRSALLERQPEKAPTASAAMRKRHAVVVSDPAGLGAAMDSRFRAIGVELTSLVCAPIELNGRYLGLIELANPTDGRPYDEADGNALTYVAQQFAELVAARGVIVDPEHVRGETPAEPAEPAAALVASKPRASSPPPAAAGSTKKGR